MSEPDSKLASSFPSTSSRLLEASRAGDSEAWRQLTTIYGELVYQWLRRVGVRADDAPDVMQEAFLAVYRGLPTFDAGRGPFRNWLFIVVRNAVFSYWRRTSDQPRGEGGTTAWERQLALIDPHAAEEPSVTSFDVILRSTLQLVRNRFQEKTWKAACRVLLDGQSPAVVAVEQGMTVAAVYTAKCRVLATLREQLSELGEFPPG